MATIAKGLGSRLAEIASSVKARCLPLRLYPTCPSPLSRAKDEKHSLGTSVQQAKGYVEALDVPFVFSATVMVSCFMTAAAQTPC